MNNLKTKLGPIFLAIFSLIPLVIWLIVRNGTYDLSDYYSLTHSLGQLSALIGASMFALSFLLTTRIKHLENYFNGLDKMYFYHHLLGAIAFILLLFHPLLLVLKFVPSDMQQAATYLLPSGSLAVNLGMVALLSMIILLVLTFFVTMKYQNWKISHKFMGLVFIIACFHIFLVKTDITYYPILKNYMAFICTIGMLSYAYGSFLRPEVGKKYDYLIESIDTSKHNITILTMKPQSEHLKFTPGQFIFIKILAEKTLQEQHPFTIASAPRADGKIKVAVKSLGDFTSNLKNITKNTPVEIEGPYGRFNYQRYKNKPQVWIAGGIGITPFLSKIEDLSKTKKADNKIDLYYCVKNKEEAVFLNEINQDIENLTIIPYFSEESGRINASKIMKISKTSSTSTQFFICGPPSMSKSIKEDLIKSGISKNNIHYEEFNLK